MEVFTVRSLSCCTGVFTGPGGKAVPLLPFSCTCCHMAPHLTAGDFCFQPECIPSCLLFLLSPCASVARWGLGSALSLQSVQTAPAPIPHAVTPAPAGSTPPFGLTYGAWHPPAPRAVPVPVPLVAPCLDHSSYHMNFSYRSFSWVPARYNFIKQFTNESPCSPPPQLCLYRKISIVICQNARFLTRSAVLREKKMLINSVKRTVLNNRYELCPRYAMFSASDLVATRCRAGCAAAEALRAGHIRAAGNDGPGAGSLPAAPLLVPAL